MSNQREFKERKPSKARQAYLEKEKLKQNEQKQIKQEDKESLKKRKQILRKINKQHGNKSQQLQISIEKTINENF
tara:strand:+ start:213 stop:437 length:225 start_codon:yes stop_codon:yes gene_type:complete